MNVFGIPTIDGPQYFKISLSDVIYIFRLWWNRRAESWHLDILDEEESPLVLGSAIKPGVNVFEQYSYLGLKGVLFVASPKDLGIDDLRGDFVLCYGTEEA